MGKKTTKKGIAFRLAGLLLSVFALGMAGHELSLRYFQSFSCGVCHEMREPVRKWEESGAALNHGNCAGCHSDPGFEGWMAMNRSALHQLVEHFKRDPKAPIKLPEEPLFLEDGKEPGYWSLVPNSRCYKCKEAKNHKPIDQPRIHKKLIKGVASQPCKDCHNHEMRKGARFYEKVLAEGEVN